VKTPRHQVEGGSLTMTPEGKGEENDKIQEGVEEFCIRNGLLKRNDRILLAVSGGPDSTAMLHLFIGFRKAFDLTLAVAHVHHGLRGSDADEDQFFVKCMARELGIPFYTERLHLPSQRTKGESPEEAARRLRFRYLFEIMQRRGFNKIAAGHTLEDNIETMLYRLASGTGPVGAAGILPMSGPVIHPLLEVNKRRILSYLDKRCINYRFDRTNDDLNIPRNRIRHEILPLLNSINRCSIEHFRNFFELLREENSLLDRLTAEALAEVLEYRSEDEYRVHYASFMRQELALRRRVVMKILEELAVGGQPYRRHYLQHGVLDFVVKAPPGKNMTLYQSREISIRKEYESLVFEKRVVDTRAGGYLYKVREIDKPLVLPEIGKELLFSIQDSSDFEKNRLSRERFFLDYDKILLPLLVRSRRPGDRIALHGVGHKKLKDIFIDQKVRAVLRDLVPVLECEDEVIAVLCSLYGRDNRVAEGCRVTNRTVHVLVGELRDWKK
jgi:tRNA(Ile)-lysidine synthase